MGREATTFYKRLADLLSEKLIKVCSINSFNNMEPQCIFTLVLSLYATSLACRNQVSRFAEQIHVPLDDRYLSLQSTATVSPSLERLNSLEVYNTSPFGARLFTAKTHKNTQRQTRRHKDT